MNIIEDSNIDSYYGEYDTGQGNSCEFVDKFNTQENN